MGTQEQERKSGKQRKLQAVLVSYCIDYGLTHTLQLGSIATDAGLSARRQDLSSRHVQTLIEMGAEQTQQIMTTFLNGC